MGAELPWLFIFYSQSILERKMHKPTFEDFRKLARDAGLVPVFREIIADLDTPLTIFDKVAGE